MRTAFDIAADVEAFVSIYIEAAGREARDSVRSRMDDLDDDLWSRWHESKTVVDNVLHRLLGFVNELRDAGLADVATNMLDRAREKAQIASTEAICEQLKTYRGAA